MKSVRSLFLAFGVALVVSTNAYSELVMNYNLKSYCQQMFPVDETARKALHQDFSEFVRKRFETVAFEKPELASIREKLPKRLAEIKEDLEASERGMTALQANSQKLHQLLEAELEPWKEIDAQTQKEVFAALAKRRAEKVQPTADFTVEEKESLKVAKEAIERIQVAFLQSHGLEKMPDRDFRNEKANNEKKYKYKKSVYDSIAKSLRFAERTRDFDLLINACSRACSTPEAGTIARFDLAQTAWREARWSQVVTRPEESSAKGGCFGSGEGYDPLLREYFFRHRDSKLGLLAKYEPSDRATGTFETKGRDGDRLYASFEPHRNKASLYPGMVPDSKGSPTHDEIQPSPGYTVPSRPTWVNSGRQYKYDTKAQYGGPIWDAVRGKSNARSQASK